jgi:CheY-like chemotaxis protein
MRVLIVDDSRDATTIVSRLLGRFGHDVRAAESGPKALDIALQFQPEAVFLDIFLPGMDGYETAKQLRKIPGTERTRIIAYTGVNPDQIRDRDAGIDVHLLKPASLDQMLEAMGVPEVQ